MNTKTLKSEIQAVKELGDKIGYGHMMALASALWRKSLAEKGYPISGAFVPTIISGIEKEMAEIAKKEADMYDGFIKNLSE